MKGARLGDCDNCRPTFSGRPCFAPHRYHSGRPEKVGLQWLLVISLAALSAAVAAAADDPSPDAAESVPAIRRIFVPADRPELLPRASQPVELSELERLIDTARAARREQPLAFLDRAEYSATLSDSELVDANLEWHVRRPDSTLSLLSLGKMNLNVSQLEWSDADSKTPPAKALWGANSVGTSALVVNRSAGRLLGKWSLLGRRLPASSEFDVDLAPAALSKLSLRIPAGLVLTSTAGTLSEPTPAPESGWHIWQLNLGSQSHCRLRMAPPPNAKVARPLVLVHSNTSYFVRSETVRLLAEFDIEVFESAVRDMRFLIDPDVQVTSVEYGDDGAIAWKSAQSPAGQEIALRLPDPVSGEGHTLQIQGIAQVKQFAPWSLPRVRLQDALETAGRVTLRLQPPFQAADVKADGYRQFELTTEADDGEILVFRRMRDDGTITVVPAEGKADLTCRAVTLIEPDPQQWSLVSQLEWKATAGSTFSTACLVSDLWDIVDVTHASPKKTGDLSGWEVRESEPGRRVLQLYFLNALKTDRPQKIRISARRLPAGPDERALVPPLIPIDTTDVEQFVVVSTGVESRPIVDGAKGIESLNVQDLPDDIRNLDFIGALLNDRRLRAVAFRSLGTTANGGLRVEPIEPLRDSVGEPSPPGDESNRAADQPDRGGPGEIFGSPASLAVTARVSGLSSGFDHYVAEFRIAPLSENARFEWSLPQPAEILDVSLDGHRIVPLAEDGTYTIASLPAAISESARKRDLSTLAVEYRVRSAMHRGPNSRRLVFPATVRPILRFELALVLPGGVRLDKVPPELSLAGFDEQLPLVRQLFGPFSRAAGTPLFHPFRKESWLSLLPADSSPAREAAAEQIWRAVSAASRETVEITIWNVQEVTWLSWLVLQCSLLAAVLLRVFKISTRRGIATAALACLCFAALFFSPVGRDLAGSALTGLALAILLPQRVLRMVQPPAVRYTTQIPVGSTQSFIPLASVLVALVGLGMALTAQAQDESPNGAARSTVRKENRPAVDVFIPMGRDGKPAAANPVAYVPTNFLPSLKRAAQPAAFPPCLIAASNFDGNVDESNRLLVTARFAIHVFGVDAVVPVSLPLGIVNLGGPDACLVDGKPHPVVVGPAGRGLIVALPGAEPLPAAPPLPRQEESNERSADSTAGTKTDPSGEPFAVRTCMVELRLYPVVDAARGDLLTATVTIPPGCQNQAALSSAVARSVMGVSPADAGQPAARRVPLTSRKTALRPGPSNQLVYFWSATEGSAIKTPVEPPAEVLAGISSLADVTGAMVKMQFHVAYQVQAGRVDSLAWHVPAGYVLEALRAPQLAGYRFEDAEEGNRRLLIEFSRPQTGDFSLVAKFVLPIDRNEKQVLLPLIDPLFVERDPSRQIGLRFHQIALRHPSDLRVGISAAPSNPPLRPRSVDDFLREWNAADARPQQAFDLEHAFAVKLAVDSVPGIPRVTTSSTARFHTGHLDWTFSADIAPAAVPQFLYRIQVDPRLRIRSVSVQEEGAERLLRWSQAREAVVLFLNDKTTRPQALKIEASLPYTASQEFELPRIRFAEAAPVADRVTLYRDAGISVRLASPGDGPAFEVNNDPAIDGQEEALLGRMDVLPGQASPRVIVQPVLPRISAETVTVLETHDGAWQFTTAVEFRVTSGQVNDFALDLPEALAARVTTRSQPASQVARQPAADGRTMLTFHPEEQGLRRFVAIVTGAADLSQTSWTVPSIRAIGADEQATWLCAPRGAIEPVAELIDAEAVPPPDWVGDHIVSAAAALPKDSYRWPGATPSAEFRLVRDVSSQTVASAARVDVWPSAEGPVTGWLGLNLEGTLSASLELDWPEHARLTALFVGGAFQPLPVPTEGLCTIPLPSNATDRLVWLSWVDSPDDRPARSGSSGTQVPWPRQTPVENCSVLVHRSPGFRVDAVLPFHSATESPAEKSLMPSIVAGRDSAGEPRPGESRDDDLAWTVMPVPANGQTFDLGVSLKIAREWPLQFFVALAMALVVALVCWRTAPFWSWITDYETAAWLVIAIFWWLCLEPGWVGLAIALWAPAKAFMRRNTPAERPAAASTAHAEPFG